MTFHLIILLWPMILLSYRAVSLQSLSLIRAKWGRALGQWGRARANGPRARRGRAKWARANGPGAHGPGAGPGPGPIWPGAHFLGNIAKSLFYHPFDVKIRANGSHGVKKQFKLGPATKNQNKKYQKT